MKNKRIIAALLCMALMTALLPGAALAAGGNLTVRINGAAAAEFASLEAAVAASGVGIENVTSIEITGGVVEAADWGYLDTSNQSGQLLKLESLRVTSGVTSAAALPAYIFGRDRNNVPKLKTVEICKVKFIDDSAFYRCPALETASFPDVTSTQRYAFSECTKLTSVSLPKLTEIGYMVFSDCYRLTTVTAPLVEKIGDNAFQKCTALTTVNFPKLETIGEFAFSESGLTAADFPEAATIGASAFSTCADLVSVDLPKAAIIQYGAFDRCKNLPAISLPKAANLADAVFGECHSLITLKLPGDLVGIGGIDENSALFDGAWTTDQRQLFLIDATGAELTGSELAAALDDYKGQASYDPATDRWQTCKLPAQPVAPAITTQPAAQSVTVGSDATFAVAATGTDPISYQWQVSVDSGTTWAAVTDGTGATSASYTTVATTLGMNGYQYCCVATNSMGRATSNAAALTVNAAPTPGPAGPTGYNSLGGSTYTGNEYPGSFAGGALTVQGPCANLTSVMVDNVILTRERDYTVNCGSTAVTFTPSYLATLKNGPHTVRVQFTDGRYMGTFTTPLASAMTAVPDVPATGGRLTAAAFVWFLCGVCCLVARTVVRRRRPYN